MESHVRSIAKALSWRVCGSTAAFGLAWLVTQRLPMAALIGVGDLVFKIGAYYVHERIWDRIAFGRIPEGTGGAHDKEAAA